jgi:hypothetical protein
LIFAAAGNNTSNEVKPIRFPARMEDVICVFSSNPFGKPSEYNPPPKYHRPNLMFPGEMIKGAWPSSLANKDTFELRGSAYKFQSGTSCSTPIAAATAASVLEFAWQERGLSSPCTHAKALDRDDSDLFETYGRRLQSWRQQLQLRQALEVHINKL